MLKIMRRIVQEVNDAEDIQLALDTMVHRVRETMETQACSVYLMDVYAKKLLLMATDGLNRDKVGQLALSIKNGLIGLVATRGEPLNIDNAPAHPNFFPIPELDEELYRAVLAVPIVHHRAVLGVLVVQQEESRCFDEAEEAFLLTMSAQLAGVVAHARASGRLQLRENHSMLNPNAQDKDIHFIAGVSSVPGIGIGQAVVVYPPADLTVIPDKTISDEEIDLEIALLNTALERVRQDILNLQGRMATRLPTEEQGLFDVYLRILEGASLQQEIVTRIRERQQWAQGALKQVISYYLQQFESMEDPYLRERASDIRDMGRRVLFYLQRDAQKKQVYPERTILVGDEVTAAALAEVPEERLVAVVSAEGSTNSHMAILARAMGVPTVMGALALPLSEMNLQTLIVNGYQGRVYISPPENLLKEFQLLVDEERQLDADLAKLKDTKAESTDGQRILLHVNIGLAGDVERCLKAGAEGVGLYRTEVPFMIRDRFPSEEEQRIIYRQLLNVFAPRPVTLRTLDVGGDKILSYLPIEEENPFLGWRGIRFTLDHPDIFLVQLRAMLRAFAGFGNGKIMFPMVTCVSELDEALRLLKQAYNECCEEYLEDTFLHPEVGVMIEVPSLVLQADLIAKRVDFLSVGSNDLTQYLLAVDRNNARVANLYSAMHPAVLMALKSVVDSGHRHGKLVSICGELAGDPAGVVLLLGMGFDVLSMNAASLPRMKWVIQNFSKAHAASILREALTFENAYNVRHFVEKELIAHDLGGLIWAGK